MATGGFARRRTGGRAGGGGEATVANIHAIGETRLGIQLALEEGGADWALLVGFRNDEPISARQDSNAKTVTVLYDQADTAMEVVEALESVSGISATLIYGTNESSLLEPHFAAGRPFLAGEPYGQYAEAYIPAVALFEHPVAATALFEAVDSGTDGITVTLDEPLAYGLDLNNWAITGHQRDQGTPDTPAQNPSITGAEWAHARYQGEFATADLPLYTDLTGDDWYLAYDTDLNRFQVANRLNNWQNVRRGSQAGTWTDILGDPPDARPWAEDGDWQGDLSTAGSFEYADQDAVEASLGAHYDGPYSNDILWFDQSDSQVKTFGAITPAVAEVKAFVDLPTSATGGIRVTHADVDGAAGNDWEFRLQAIDQDDDPPVVNQHFPAADPPYFRSLVKNGTTAQEFLTYSEAPHRTESTAEFYGTEDGSTVLVTGGSFNHAAFGGTHDFAGGVDEDFYVPAIPGDPEEPIHIIVDPNARDESRLDEEPFPTTGLGTHSIPLIGAFADDAAATAALGGVGTAVYYNTTNAGSGLLVFRLTQDGGASWGSVGTQALFRAFVGARWLSLPYNINQQITNQGRFANAAAALAHIQANRAAFDASFRWAYFDTTLGQVRLINIGAFVISPAIEVYYNIAAGGRLTEADTLGPILEYINTHLDGLTAAYAGSADADTAVTRPFANRSAFSGGSVNGLRVLLDRPIAIGADGNDWTLLARQRFAGGAQQAERQAHILIYTTVSRSGGIRLELDADIQARNENNHLVDVSSGALGNEWTFEAVTGTAAFSDVIVLNPAQRQVVYHTPEGILGVEARTFLTTAQSGGNGVSARTFGSYHANSSPFILDLARVNGLPRHFSGGEDYHPAGVPDPIAVNVGPHPATARLQTHANGGLEFSLTDPAGESGSGWILEFVEDNDRSRTIELDSATRRVIVYYGTGAGLPVSSGQLVNEVGPATNGIDIEYFGVQDDSIVISPTGISPYNLDQREFLGGLDQREIGIHYSRHADGAIARADNMGEVKAVIDAIDGLSSFYYGGADANTPADRHTPWEHDFEDGDSQDFDLTSFALGPVQNTFTGATRAAAEAARDAYAVANPTWVVAYRGNASLWISLRWDAGGQIGQILRANASNPPVAGDWVDQALALKGEKGDRGNPGPAGGLNETEVRTLIGQEVKDYARTGGRLIEPGDADTAFMLDSEFNGAAIRAMLGFTQAEQDALLEDDNARIESGVLILPRLDGTEVRLTLPQQMAAADGVINGFVFANDLSTLTISRSEGADITVNIPAGLRAVPRTDAEIDARVNALRGARVMLSTVTTHDAANHRLNCNAPFIPALGDRVTLLMPDPLPGTDDALSLRATATDVILPFHDRDGNDLSTNDVVAGRLYEVVRFNAEYRILESPSEAEAPPAGTHLRYFGWKAAGAIVTADLDDTLARTNSSMTDEGQYPPNNVVATRWFAVPATEGQPTEHYLPPNPLNTIIGFNRQAGTIDDGDGEAHIVMVAAAQTVITATPTNVRIGHN